MIRHTLTEEIEMMRNPDNWPMWPFLPLKHRKEGFRKVGFLRNNTLSGEHTDTTVYVGSIFAPRDATPVKYESLEQIAEEWRVD